MLGLLALTLLSHNPLEASLAKAYREDQAGWVLVHLEGEPKEIGFQHGSLLSSEIDDAQKALRIELKSSTGKEWTWFRDTTKTLFWDKLDPEYKDEIDGIAEGLKSKGLPYDRWDILAFNAHIEVEGYYIPWLNNKASNKESCSSFVATGSQTKGGQIVLGHNLWWGYTMGQRWNAMLDIKPTKGNRILMDALPGFIHSGSDFAINSAGLVISETTISGIEGFDPKGLPEFMRMRKATQYATNLDQWVQIMNKGNNGGYANTWLLGDTKTGEIGKLEQGLKNVIFSRSSDGYFVGSNFPENPKLIAEEVPGGWSTDPKLNSCEARKFRWNSLLKANKGQVDAEKAKQFLADDYNEVIDKKGLSGSTLCGKSFSGGAVNTKVITAEMIKNWQVWGRMGFTDGSEMKFTSRPNPMLRDIKSHPWVLLSPKQ